MSGLLVMRPAVGDGAANGADHYAGQYKFQNRHGGGVRIVCCNLGFYDIGVADIYNPLIGVVTIS
ncbi:hypothetical protein [Methylogaea oryzae]|uniref:Uncharacterized protein n=1 Tax=Methylogaea oryzae TaxID=1295382 RepID=A0A8D4VLR7_9GAMM|nr:hypothetical protein [Methylogaea oryzae]BBL70145.1 hypothetical protein MoryE10_07510 [Methylogaea oryzae]